MTDTPFPLDSSVIDDGTISTRWDGKTWLAMFAMLALLILFPGMTRVFL